MTPRTITVRCYDAVVAVVTIALCVPSIALTPRLLWLLGQWLFINHALRTACIVVSSVFLLKQIRQRRVLVVHECTSFFLYRLVGQLPNMITFRLYNRDTLYDHILGFFLRVISSGVSLWILHSSVIRSWKPAFSSTMLGFAAFFIFLTDNDIPAEHAFDVMVSNLSLWIVSLCYSYGWGEIGTDENHARPREQSEQQAPVATQEPVRISDIGIGHDSTEGTRSNEKAPASGQALSPSPPATFSYEEIESLAPEGKEIRMLTILQNSSSSTPAPIKCRIRNVATDKAQGYTALSYEWTAQDATSSMEIEGKMMAIRPNLHHALGVMRHHGHRDIWVDAICIDQEKPSEVNSHMNIIKKIYQGADQVAVWLGPAADKSNWVMDELERGTRVVDIAPIHRSPGSDEDTAVAKFLSRTYWQRVWIVQEVAVGMKVQLYCGMKQTAWRNLRCFRDEWSSSPDEKKTYPFARTVYEIRQHRRISSQRPKNTLEILDLTRAFKATNDEDKVLGLLGLAEDWESYRTPPDCLQDPRSLCISMAKGVVEKDETLDIILLGRKYGPQAPFRRGNKYLADQRHLPSWCPDFVHFAPSVSEQRLISYLAGQPMCIFGRKSADATGSSLTGKISFTKDGVHDVLNVQGVEMGSITALGVSASLPTPPDHKCGNIDAEGRPWNDTELYNALGQTLLMYDKDYDVHAQDPTFLLWIMDQRQGLLETLTGGAGASGADDLKVHQWLNANADMVIHGKTFRTRATSWPSKMTGTGNWAKSVLGAVKSLAEGNTSDLSIRARGHIVTAIQSAVDQDMRLMTLSRDGRMGWAPQNSLLGDKVFLLEGCHFPVVLRRRFNTGYKAMTGYRVVGHAYIHGVMHNEHWARMGPEDLEPLSLY